MYHIQSPFSFCFKFFPISFLIFFVFVTLSSSSYVDDRYTNCAPIKSTCGTFSQKITYPFWEEGNLPDYCGHPAFQLDCLENYYLRIKIVKDTYYMLNIDYKGYVFTISKPPFSEGPCPLTKSQLTNTSLDLTLFNFTSDSQNATLFYDCLESKIDMDSPNTFTCPPISYLAAPSTPSLFNNSLGFLATDKKWEKMLTTACGIKVYIPVLSTAVLGLVNNSSSVNAVLSKGFEVKWIIDHKQCDGCLKSGGRCGYNSTLQQPVCFCKDDAYFTSCGDSQGPIEQTSTTAASKERRRRAIMIGVGVAASTSIVLLSILCFIYQRRLKKHRSSPPFITQDKISYASSVPSNVQTVNRSTYFGVQVFNHRELEEVTDSFNPLKELGDGGFGTVYYGMLRDGREVAIKRLYEHNNKRAEQFMNEVEILAHLRHKNLVTLYGCTSRQSRELLLVYEYVPNGTVADHLHGRKANQGLLPWATRLSITVETASALVYLHASDIIHRDVKTQNILLDNDFSVKVADFGLSRLFPLDVTHVSTAPQGTPGYVDPEYHQCYHLTEKSDVFSFGVVMAEIISSKPAVDITRRRQEINLSNMLISKIQNRALHEFVDTSLGFESDSKVNKEVSAVAELAFQCLQSTREERPSMEEVLEILCNIQGQRNKVHNNKADVLDIPADDVYMLKSDLSPTSPTKRQLPYASA